MAKKQGQLITDVTPLLDVPTYQRKYGCEHMFTMTTGKIVAALHKRGVTIEDIFGIYYAIEAQADARDDEIFGNDEEGQHGKPLLTVGDVELAGLAQLPVAPLDRQPF